MDGVRRKKKGLVNLDSDAMGKLPKDRRDWLEIFGNQWGTRNHGALPLDEEEKRALAAALNPFANRQAAA